MKNILPVCILLAWIGAADPLTASIYQFTIDTQSLNTQTGYLDFQLNSGGFPALGVGAQITGFTITGGSYDSGDIQLTGDATGTLPASLTLKNTSGYNDAFQPVTLGTSLSFLAALSGPGIDSPGNPGTLFAFSLYDASGMVPELTTSMDGTIAGISADNFGVTPFTNPSAPGAESAATVTTPEPSNGLLLLVGLGCGLYAVRRTVRER